MISFLSDYNNGTHPAILQRLIETNNEKHPGYGEDVYCKNATDKIRKAIEKPQADVFFLVGGTQTNATVIDAMLANFEGVVAAATAHIAVHEAGAIEFGRHKVLVVPSQAGKIDANNLQQYLSAFHADPNKAHCVQPGMVYITFPTELGTLYTAQELADIHHVCQSFSLPLFIDGARLSYGLAAAEPSITLPYIAQHCDVFYIGGTKVGAMFGEAVVFPQGNAPRSFFTTIKQHGALLAKGRYLGIQFDTLFTHSLYLEIGKKAVQYAHRICKAMIQAGLRMTYNSPTNQQFVILSDEQQSYLAQNFAFEVWEKLSDGNTVYRFVTSWATTEYEITALEDALQQMRT